MARLPLCSRGGGRKAEQKTPDPVVPRQGEGRERPPLSPPKGAGTDTSVPNAVPPHASRLPLPCPLPPRRRLRAPRPPRRRFAIDRYMGAPGRLRVRVAPCACCDLCAPPRGLLSRKGKGYTPHSAHTGVQGDGRGGGGICRKEVGGGDCGGGSGHPFPQSPLPSWMGKKGGGH